MPANVRRSALLLGFLMAAIMYLDRVCISVAAPAISKELRLSDMQMGYVFSVFALAYAIFGVPTGWLGDQIGQRKMLLRIVGAWSVFTMLMGAVWSYGALVVTQFMFGVAEAGAFPTLSRALARIFAAGERARANGVMWTGARIGGAIAPVVAALLIARIGWRATFVVFGSVGFFWCAAFWRWFRGGQAESRPRPEPTPWRALFSSGDLWGLFGAYFCSAYGFWFLVTWLPTFLIRECGATFERSGIYAGLPLASGALGCLAGGILSDWLVPRIGSLKWARRAIGMGGFALAALGFGLAAVVRDPLVEVLCLTLAAGAHDFTVPVAWASAVDIGSRFGGTTGAFMNLAASLSAMISPISAAWLAGRFGSFRATIAVTAVAYLAAAIVWSRIDPTRPEIAG
jgi:MFS family permease